MALIDWSEHYSMGVELFDKEHLELIAILNQLHEALEAGDHYRLESLCYRLMEHTIQHFRHEEMYFDDWAYPQKEAHRNAHKQLRREVFALQSKLLADPDEEAMNALSTFLKEWLTRHILTFDRDYGEFLRTKGLR
ncbi:hemerythrin-like metal-binding protein [Rhizomicrobium palustre]|uniref:Hemerythrin-like metal-binding protein n=1 Tax=Rhizomicrobium palustre TaxID=189966 RepID=A0A846MYW0_9PROT|nr:bacteriohemerythrin [Rhizomicrobium palustre]NIK88405.1 hemerythrin-like metal-binding protein [Rhizomicrobium palustre]